MTNVYESNERLIRLVNDLLNLSRIESGRIELHKESVSLPDLLKSVVEVFQNRAKEKGLYLKLKKPKQKIPEVNIDKEKFSQVIYNIIDNAIRYTHQGGITIQTELSQSKQDKIVINIKDTGEGIDQHDLKELFQSFSRGATGNQYWTEGMGLGLCIAQKFARLHDGRIWVESEGKNQGAIFYIELPV